MMEKTKAETVAEKISGAVVGTYKKIEAAVVGGYTKLEDTFVDHCLTKDGETVAEAKARLKKNTQK